MVSSTQSAMSEEITDQLTPEEEESLDEIIKEAESDLESQEVLDQSLAILAENEGLDKDSTANLRIYPVVVIVNNQTEGPLTVMAEHIYAGHIVKPFPSPIGPGKTGTFVITNTFGNGVETAVVYTGNNKNKYPCAWLLCFIVNKANVRVYGECGKKSDFINIDRKLVEKKLITAGKIVKFHDIVTETSLIATIQGSADKAVVAATFIG